MKKICLFISILFCLNCGQSISAQNKTMKEIFNELEKQDSVFKIGNETYKLSRERQMSSFANMKNVLKLQDTGNPSKILVKDQMGVSVRIKDMYKKIFSRARMEELKKSSFTMSCIFDTTGYIKEVTFSVKHAPDLTIEEIVKLENALKKMEIKHEDLGSGKHIYRIMIVCDFSILLREMEIAK